MAERAHPSVSAVLCRRSGGGITHRGRYPLRGKAASLLPAAQKIFLSLLTCQAMPLVQKRLPVSEQAEQTALLGYSLGGLAALWQTAQDWHFGMCGSISGSLWYDNFPAWFAERIDGFREKSLSFSGTQ